MKIDIDRLTEAELIDLNNRIVERLRFLNPVRAYAQMLEFRIGDRMSFHPEGKPAVVGMLTRYNRKTVTMITDDGQHWNVSPQFLRRATQPAGCPVLGFKGCASSTQVSPCSSGTTLLATACDEHR